MLKFIFGAFSFFKILEVANTGTLVDKLPTTTIVREVAKLVVREHDLRTTGEVYILCVVWMERIHRVGCGVLGVTGRVLCKLSAAMLTASILLESRDPLCRDG